MSNKILNKVNNDIFSYDTDENVFKMTRVMPTEIHHTTAGVGPDGYILTSTGPNGNGWTWTDPSVIETPLRVLNLPVTDPKTYSAGTDGYVLISKGSSDPPSWTNQITMHTVDATNYKRGSRTFVDGGAGGSFTSLEIKALNASSETFLIDGQSGDVTCHGTMSIDTITRKTSTGDGVDIENVNINGNVITATNYKCGSRTFVDASVGCSFTSLEIKALNASSESFLIQSNGDVACHGTLSIDTISEKTTDAGITLSSVVKMTGIQSSTNTNKLLYNSTTGEITYQLDSGGGATEIVGTSIKSTLSGNNVNNSNSISLGVNAGNTGQNSETVAIGFSAGSENQGTHSIAIGTNAARYDQLGYSIAIGVDAGSGTTARAPPRGQQLESIAIGRAAGYDHQKERNIAIGPYAQQNTQIGSQSVAIGYRAAQTSQGGECVAIGYDAGNLNQGNSSVAIGYEAGKSNQGTWGVAIGNFSGKSNQGNYGVALGYNAGQTDQGQYSTALGSGAGQNQQGNFSTAIGYAAGYLGLSENSVAIGRAAAFVPDASLTNYIVINATGTSLEPSSSNGFHVKPIRDAVGANKLLYNPDTGEITYQLDSGGGGATEIVGTSLRSLNTNCNVNNTEAVSLGHHAGSTGQNINAIAIGAYAGENSQKHRNIAIGTYAQQNTGTGDTSIGIGWMAAQSNQSSVSVAIGHSAGKSNQGGGCVAIGYATAQSSQGHEAAAIGDQAGFINQQGRAVAFGREAGNNNQGLRATAIGALAGRQYQGQYSTAIGYGAGYAGLTEYSIAIGTSAASSNPNAANNFIIINATNQVFEPTSSNGFHVKPINSAANSNKLLYNSDTGEITYQPDSGGGGGTLSDLTDVAIASLANNQILSYNGTNWVNTDLPASSSTLSDLTDVAIASLNTNQILSYNGTNWVNTDQSILIVGTSIKSTLPGNNVNSSLSVSLGNYAGNSGQADRTIAIGNYAASTNQSVFGIAIGAIAGQEDQGEYSIACGWAAGQFRQGIHSIAIGKEAGVWDQGAYSIALGRAAGCLNSQGDYAVAIGDYAGYDNQSGETVAIGLEAGRLNQGGGSIAIGRMAGYDAQGDFNAIAIGNEAGKTRQGNYGIAIGRATGEVDQDYAAIAIGLSAGRYNAQGNSAVAIGHNSGNNNQGNYTVALGTHTATSNQSDGAVAIGDSAGRYDQAYGSVACGRYSGHQNQHWSAVAVGAIAGYWYQKQQAVAIGYESARHNQNEYSVAVGAYAARDNQGWKATALGVDAGRNTQGWYTVAVGNAAGRDNQGEGSIAIGNAAGLTDQGVGCVAIGRDAARLNSQGNEAVAIGYQAGYDNQGAYSVAIGNNAGRNNQVANSIVLNAQSGTALDAPNSGFFVKPINSVSNSNKLLYNSGTGEITYQPDAALPGQTVSPGMVVQYKHIDYKKQIADTAGTGWRAPDNDINTGFVVHIKPISASSKILVKCNAHVGVKVLNDDARWWGARLYKKVGTGDWTHVSDADNSLTGDTANGQAVWFTDNMGQTSMHNIGTEMDHFVGQCAGEYMDTAGSTDDIYYTIYWKARIGDSPGTGDLFLNRQAATGDNYRPLPISNWNAIEIWNEGDIFIPSSQQVNYTGVPAPPTPTTSVEGFHLVSSNSTGTATQWIPGTGGGFDPVYLKLGWNNNTLTGLGGDINNWNFAGEYDTQKAKVGNISWSSNDAGAHPFHASDSSFPSSNWINGSLPHNYGTGIIIEEPGEYVIRINWIMYVPGSTRHDLQLLRNRKGTLQGYSIFENPGLYISGWRTVQYTATAHDCQYGDVLSVQFKSNNNGYQYNGASWMDSRFTYCECYRIA